MEKSRAYSEEEIRDQVIAHIHMIVDYWEKVEPLRSRRDAETELHARLSGIAFSILTMLDGEAASLPGFAVMAVPHPDDKKFHKENGENWYPKNVDIGGALHEYYCRKR